MSSISDSQLPPPRDWSAFEEMCADLFEREWNYRHTVRHGRQGQRQNGVDIYGRPDGSGHGGVQCKGKRLWPPTELTTTEIDKEVSEALNFRPRLTEFVFATTALNDVSVQEHARIISEAHEKKGLFSVHVYGWEELVRRITRHSDLIRKHFEFATIEDLEQQISSIPDRLEELVSSRSLGPVDLINREIEEQLDILKKARFFGGFDHRNAAKKLAERITGGDLNSGSNSKKSPALAWCARVLANSDTELAAALLSAGSCEAAVDEWTIAAAFVDAARGDWRSGINRLSGVTSPASISAAFFIVSYHVGLAQGLEWLSDGGYQFSDLNADGKFRFLGSCLECERWDTALDVTQTLTSTDYATAPALHSVTASANLVQAVPGEYRKHILQHIPFEVGTFPLATDANSLSCTRCARQHFEESAEAARALGLKDAGNIASDYALWLELRASESQSAAKDRLRTSMGDPAHSLRRLHFALQFGIELDLEAVTRAIDRETALTGGKSAEAAYARFALAFIQESEGEVADYIERHRSQLDEHIDPTSMARLEIEILARAGRVHAAEARLEELRSAGVDEPIETQLRRIIAEASGADPVTVRIAEYEEAPTVNGLSNLVDLLERQKDWGRMAHYAARLHEEVRSVESANRWAQALNAQGDLRGVRNLLAANPEFSAQSEFLKSLWGMVLYHDGNLKESKRVVDELRGENDRADYRELAVNIAIASGDWESLATHVESEWSLRSERSAAELLRAAQLAHSIQSNRVRGLLQEATDSAADDPEVFLGAFQIAVNEGWEGGGDVADWFQKATELSADDGPIQKVSLRELVDRKPEWDQRASDVWQKLKNGEMPIFTAAMAVNQTLIELFLLPAMANRNESDLRRKTDIYAYSPMRQPMTPEINRVGIDATALLTLASCDLIHLTIESFDEVIVPHSTLGWLFEEKQRISFHQPSRVRNATKLQELIQTGKLHNVVSTQSSDPGLAAEVGIDLAGLIAEARAGSQEDGRQRLVVRSAPVHRVGSLLDEVANLSGYAEGICSCSAVIDKLREVGQFTAAETKSAISYLNAHEERWPSEPKIADGATLYLDNLSITYLQWVGALEKLGPAGLKTFISPSQTEEIGALLRYQSLASDAEGVIEKLRHALATGLEGGRIKLASLPSSSDEDIDRFRLHPTVAILDVAPMTDAVVVDDRFMNQHPNVEHQGGVTPVITTLDLIEVLRAKGAIGDQDRWELRTSLRQAGFMFFPIAPEEWTYHLSQAAVVDKELRETAELRAIRENVLQMRMSVALYFPKEVNWLITFQKALAKIVKSQWTSEIGWEDAKARSVWVLDLLDMRGWAASYEFGAGANVGRMGFLTAAMSLLAPDISDAVARGHYWEWLDEVILGPLEANHPDIYEQLLQVSEESVAEIVNAHLEGLRHDNE